MATKLIKWSLDRLVMMIVDILTSKFDCFIVIEGNRGLGKSTLAYHLGKKVARKFKIIKKETDMFKREYLFSPKRTLLYTRDSVINFFTKRNRIGIADEMINVTFNRDFYAESQKDLIKMINMNRDYCNLFVACVPQFQTLDAQIKGLCKIRITVLRRGLAIIQTPNRSIYSKDRWDTALNEKIERAWLKKGTGKPKFSKLTTVRGAVVFPALNKRDEASYQEVKDLERNIIAKEKEGMVDSKGKKIPTEKEVIDIVIDMLESNQIRNSVYLDGIAVGYNLSPDAMRSKVVRKLKAKKKPHVLTHYYWDAKGRKRTKEDIQGMAG